MNGERWFERLAAGAEYDTADMPHAPARLKARIYSALVNQMAADGRLLSLTETKADGHALCIFEEAMAVMPVGEDVKSMNPCRICHARVMGERMEHAPIYWPGCPYAKFHQG